VDVRPIECVTLVELDAHGVLIDRLDELDMGGRIAHALGHVEHGPEPLDVRLILGIESLDELGGDRSGRHLFNRRGCFLSGAVAAALLRLGAVKHEDRGGEQEAPEDHVLRSHLTLRQEILPRPRQTLRPRTTLIRCPYLRPLRPSRWLFLRLTCLGRNRRPSHTL